MGIVIQFGRKARLEINPHASGMAPDSAFDALMSGPANRRNGRYSYQAGRENCIGCPRGDAEMCCKDSGYASRDIPGDGVQAHSKGDLYPCVIGVIERYEVFPSFQEWRGMSTSCVASRSAYEARKAEFYARPLESRFRSRAFELTYHGHSEEYASYADAATVARAILASPIVAERFAKGEQL